MPARQLRPSASRLRKIDAEHRRIRRELYHMLIDTIDYGRPKARLYKQYVVAHRLGCSRQRAADLLNGRLHLFNSETLIAMLQRYGVTVAVTVRERRHLRLYDDPGPH